MPTTPPTIMITVDLSQPPTLPKNSGDQTPAIRNAGRVKMAPAATDSPMEPTVRVKFSSMMLWSLNRRSTAMPRTAAG